MLKKLLILTVVLFACKKQNNTEPTLPPYYLNVCLGTYKDTSHTWIQYPSGNVMTTYENYRAVEIVVTRGDIDSTLSFAFSYEDSSHANFTNLKFDANLSHFNQWGGGSGYGHRTIQFSADSVLTYDAFQKCGIPCSSGEDFVAYKK